MNLRIPLKADIRLQSRLDLRRSTVQFGKPAEVGLKTRIAEVLGDAIYDIS